MAEYIDNEAEVSGDELSDISEFDKSTIGSLNDFISDSPIRDSPNQHRTLDLLLAQASPIPVLGNVHEFLTQSQDYLRITPEDKKKANKLTSSCEKLSIRPSTSKKFKRSLFNDVALCASGTFPAPSGASTPTGSGVEPSVLFGGSLIDGVYSYPDITEERTDEIETLLQNTEHLTVPETPSLEVTVNGLSAIAAEASLRRSFFTFSITSDDRNVKKKEGALWNAVAKTMKNEKTMQKNWMVFCEKPLTGRREGPYRCHVGLEAVLCTDSEGIRAKTNDTYCLYMLEYRSKSRSHAGLKQLLSRVGIEHALIGTPFQSKPLVRDWIHCFTSPLTDKAERDLEWLTSQMGKEYKQTFSPNDLIAFCEEVEPASLDVLIALYRAEAEKGNQNACNWIESTSSIQHANNCYKMWKATIRGKTMQMSLVEYVNHRHTFFQEGDAKQVERLLACHGFGPLQLISTVIHTLRKWLKGNPKQNVLVLVGPGGTGKSMFAEAITLMMDGAILSISDSTFWKQGMIGKRTCMIDDITPSQWKYLDMSERRTLDGGLISVNKKYSDPIECRMPPTIITTNYDVTKEEQFSFLANRLTWLHFKTPLPRHLTGQQAGLTKIPVTPADVSAFFLKYKTQLDLD
ncbi:MAG: E1 protein [Oncorhynchus mykiss-associated papillomavirus 1]|uniref:DNA 3'-5' helicase n=1 Tax=Papillomaviridae sp. TaxID=2052558 RepID=A0A2Z4GUF4_9PAPI|nr:MAG: E1 protein [Oncorhynchus mykiss-associated papillomavirus 1]